MALVHCLFLSLFILLMVLHPGAANYAPEKSQEAADSLADSLAAWKKDGLEPLGELGAYAKADGLQKSPITRHMHNPTELPKSEEKKAGESPQTHPKNSEKAGETTEEVPNAHKHIESIFCSGTGCMTGIVIVLAAMPAGILICSLIICWWCKRKRRLSGDRQERARLITHSDSQTSSPEPALPLQ